MTTTTIAVPRDVPDGYMPIPTAEQLADALDGVRCFHDMSAELIAPELLANLLAPAAQPAAEQSPTDKQSLTVAEQSAPGEVEEVEVVGWVDPENIERMKRRDLCGFMIEEKEDSRRSCAVMTVAQHQRIVAAISEQQSAPPEFCCELSYKVAKQAAWGARDLTQCKCDHNEYCEHCWPDDFREGGKWHGKFVAQQSAHVSVPRELLESAACLLELGDMDGPTYRKLRALLNGGEA